MAFVVDVRQFDYLLSTFNSVANESKELHLRFTEDEVFVGAVSGHGFLCSALSYVEGITEEEAAEVTSEEGVFVTVDYTLLRKLLNPFVHSTSTKLETIGFRRDGKKLKVILNLGIAENSRVHIREEDLHRELTMSCKEMKSVNKAVLVHQDIPDAVDGGVVENEEGEEVEGISDLFTGVPSVVLKEYVYGFSSLLSDSATRGEIQFGKEWVTVSTSTIRYALRNIIAAHDDLYNVFDVGKGPRGVDRCIKLDKNTLAIFKTVLDSSDMVSLIRTEKNDMILLCGMDSGDGLPVVEGGIRISILSDSVSHSYDRIKPQVTYSVDRRYLVDVLSQMVGASALGNGNMLLAFFHDGPDCGIRMSAGGSEVEISADDMSGDDAEVVKAEANVDPSALLKAILGDNSVLAEGEDDVLEDGSLRSMFFDHVEMRVAVDARTVSVILTDENGAWRSWMNFARVHVNGR